MDMSSAALPIVFLARHGETAWTLSGQHTGLTDLPLTAQGEAEAAQLGQRLRGMTFTTVLTSPLQRAVRTCEVAGFGSVAQIEPDLREWNYGTFSESSQRAGWTLSPTPAGTSCSAPPASARWDTSTPAPSR
jgi:probable phosphoglycerate mutase